MSAESPVRALHGVALQLDDATANILKHWLDPEPPRPGGPVIEVRVAELGRAPLPVLEVLLSEPRAWLGRTAAGLLIGGVDGCWFSIEGAPAVVHCGGLPSTRDADDTIRGLLSVALITALRTVGVYALHAGAVCDEDHALVLLGDSGAGKSTTTTALVSAGYGYLGDDEVLLRERAGQVELLAHWPEFRLTERVLPLFAKLKAHVSRRSENPKWQLDATAAFPGQRVSHWLGPTWLLFLARSSTDRSLLVPMSLTQTTGLLIAQSSALGLGGHPNPRQHLDLLALLARRARFARLELGREWLEDPLAASRRLSDALGSFAALSARPEGHRV